MMGIKVMVTRASLLGSLALWLMFVIYTRLAFIVMRTGRTSANAIPAMRVMVINAGYLVSADQ